MKVDIYISERNGNRSIQIPWLPEKINFKSGGTIRASYDIMDKGPVEVQTGSGLCEYSWESAFPGEKRTDTAMLHGEWKYPQVYHNTFEEWKQKKTPLHIMVIGFPINKDVILDDYNGSAAGAFGDIEYDISFLEDRDIAIQVTSTQSQSQSQTKRQTTQNATYTVKSGDSLWKIAQAQLGKGSRHGEIYQLNKEIIESTAKKHGYKSSNNGWWIFPSTTLKLPAK